MILLLGMVWLVANPVAAQDPAVPAEYQPLYDTLDSTLTNFNTAYAAELANPTGNPTFGAELLTANGNRGEILLEDITYDATLLYMDALQAMGAGGVSIQIAYPLLLTDYPRADEYLAFYQRVVDAAHERGLLVLIENGPVFPDGQYSSVSADFSGLTVEAYFAGRTQMIVSIATEIRPDYLSMGEEPNTEKMITGLDFTVEEYLAFVDATLAAVGDPVDMLIGVGTDVWEAPFYLDDYLARTDLDFINFHLYPVGSARRDFLAELLQQGQRVRDAGKAVLIGETWLYKLAPVEFETRGAAYQAIFGIDMFDFWAPLDQQHIETVAAIARAGDFEYVSFFWSQYFFSYVPYSEANALSYGQRYQAVNRAAFAALLDGQLSQAGEAFRAINGG